MGVSHERASHRDVPIVGYRPQALLATMEPKSDVRWLRSTSGHLVVPAGACWCLLVPAGAY